MDVKCLKVMAEIKNIIKIERMKTIFKKQEIYIIN